MTDIKSTWEERNFSKYRYSPNILGLIELLSNPLQDTADVLNYILSHKSIDEAEGELLDFMGELIGVIRPPAQEPDGNLLWLCLPEDEADDLDGSMSLAPVDESTGGYLCGEDGILSVSDPGSYMSDTDYRVLIRAKASSFRKIADRETLYTYLLNFGVRCKIIESTRVAELEPHSYDALNYWVRDYIIKHGFNPSGIQIKFVPQTVPDPELE
jgi:hypothetical protein